MKIDKPINSNYCATITHLPATRFSLVGLDNLEGANIFGYQVIVSKGTPNELGVFFPAESQLSDEYCFENNLYRHANLNKTPDQKGYLEDNRRVRAIKFKGNTSSGFFMPLKSLEYIGIDINILKEGDEFDFLNGKEVCRKYEVARKVGRQQEKVDRGFVRADKKFMPEHIDTENFFKNWDKIPEDTEVIVTQKIHGTSIRVGHTLVNIKPTFRSRLATWLGVKVQKNEYAYLYGSRKVIKDANNPNQQHFYEQDIWSLEGHKLDGLLPENYIVYAELVGWTPDGKEIQKNYTYGIPKGTCELYIYRVALINEEGLMTDLTWNQIKEFCAKNGLKHVAELVVTRMKNLTGEVGSGTIAPITKLLDTRFFENGYRNALYLGENKDIVDEGVCIRADGLQPKILKAKSPIFLQHETELLDVGEEDLESSQN